VFRDGEHDRELVPTALTLILIDWHDLTSVDASLERRSEGVLAHRIRTLRRFEWKVAANSVSKACPSQGYLLKVR